MSAPEPPVEFVYRFILAKGKAKEFRFTLDPESLTLTGPLPKKLPDWTKLEHNKCSNCPLKEKDSPHCPAAVSLVDVVDAFSDCLSYEEADVEIETRVRKSAKRVPLAAGIRSMIGLRLASSGCPILDRLKPLVRTHLPFATWDETAMRVVGAYLLGQYFIAKRGGKPDWEMKRLVSFYDEIKTVNRALCERVRPHCEQDAPINAVAELDSIADMTSLLIKRGRIGNLQKTLSAYFSEEDAV